jgi:hypothetical protein
MPSFVEQVSRLANYYEELMDFEELCQYIHFQLLTGDAEQDARNKSCITRIVGARTPHLGLYA